MESLPFELFRGIMQHLPLRERVRLRLVCKSWNVKIKSIPVHEGYCGFCDVADWSNDPFHLDALCTGADLSVRVAVRSPDAKKEHVTGLIRDL